MNELRKYIREVLSENILKEYLTQDTVALKQYFSYTDEQHKKYLPEQFAHFFNDFLIEEGIEFERPKNVVPSDYEGEPDVEVDQFEDDEYGLMYWLEQNNKELYDRFANYLFTKLKENTLPIPEEDVPAWSYFDNPQLVKNQWLIHFTKDARAISAEGFKYGVNEIDRLGLTTSIGEFEKKYGGYNFAYLLSDFQRYAYKGYGKYKYGDEAVIFRASGIKLWHHGDEEPQVIFYGNTATDIIPITEGENKKWAVRSAKTLNVVFEDDELQRVVYWIDRNYDQYRKSLREGVEKKQLVCPVIKLTKEIIDEVKKYKTSEQLLRAGGINIEALDRAAHGFNEEDVKTLMPNKLHIKWKDDWESVKWEQEKSGLSKQGYAKKINLKEPIDVSYENGKFYVEDGHHRLFAAAVLKKPLNVTLEIKDNPITKLAPELSYDDFHRCVFNQVKREENSTIEEGQILGEMERREIWKKEIAQVAKQLNVQLTNFLGDGVWGVAYEIPGNKVLKITEDEREINNAKHLVGKKNKLMADIYKIYSIKGSSDKKVIIMEKLTPLPKEYVKALDIFGGYFDDFYNSEWTWGEMRFNGYEEDFDNVLKTAQYNGIPISDIYSDILQILEEAGSKGIDITDMHEGNMGMKNGNLAIFDIT